MRILMYGWEFPPKISGGLGVACHAIVKELLKKGINLTLVLPQTANNIDLDQVNLVSCASVKLVEDTSFQTKGMIDIKHPDIFTCLRPYGGGSFPELASNESVANFLAMLSEMEISSEIKQMVEDSVQRVGDDHYTVNLFTEVIRYAWFAGKKSQDITCDIIHAHDWLTILAALEAKRRSHKPVVFHVHSLEIDRGGSMVDQRIYAIEKYGLEQANQIIAVSQYTKDNIIKYYGIRPEKITVVHNGIYYEQNAINSIRITDRPQMVLFLGRITHQKGPYYFIETARRVLEKKPDVQFVLVGSGDLLVDMIEHAAGLKIGKNVHFTGFLDRDEVHKIFGLADIYVMPSVSEPFGLSVLEAISANVPALISNKSGVSEVLRHSLVVDFWDTENMAEKIIALLNSSKLRQAALAEAKDYLPTISWDKTAEKLIDIYRKLN